MKIGLLSDTHGHLDSKILEHFSSCDELWHAGDIGDMSVADELEKFRPLRGVFGNIDDKDIQARFPEDNFFSCDGLSIWMTHIGGKPPRYNPRVRKQLMHQTPDIFICGHSHILRVGRDPDFQNMLYLNPGAAGHQGFHPIRTVLRFEITRGEVRNMEAIELGKRGRE